MPFWKLSATVFSLTHYYQNDDIIEIGDKFGTIVVGRFVTITKSLVRINFVAHMKIISSCIIEFENSKLSNFSKIFFLKLFLDFSNQN